MVNKVQTKSLIYNIILFIVILFISLSIFYILQSYVALESPIIELFHHLGYVDAEGTTTIHNTVIQIDYQCSGFFSIFVLLAIIFSPITLLSKNKKIILFLIGTIILYFANIFRLFLLFYLANLNVNIDLVHIFGWLLMSLIIFLIWFYSIKNKALHK